MLAVPDGGSEHAKKQWNFPQNLLWVCQSLSGHSGQQPQEVLGERDLLDQ